jgi:hypothetical protein
MTGAQDRFDDLVELVRDGFLPLETTARNVAEENDLPLHTLESAVTDAYRQLFKSYILEISRGRTIFVTRAYEIAREQKFSVDEIANALNTAKSQATSSYRSRR